MARKFLKYDTKNRPGNVDEKGCLTGGGGNDINVILSRDTGSTSNFGTVKTSDIVIEHFDVDIDKLKAGSFKGVFLHKYTEYGMDQFVKYDVTRVRYDDGMKRIKVLIGPDNQNMLTSTPCYLEVEIDINTTSVAKVTQYQFKDVVLTTV